MVLRPVCLQVYWRWIPDGTLSLALPRLPPVPGPCAPQSIPERTSTHHNTRPPLVASRHVSRHLTWIEILRETFLSPAKHYLRSTFRSLIKGPATRSNAGVCAPNTRSHALTMARALSPQAATNTERSSNGSVQDCRRACRE